MEEQENKNRTKAAFPRGLLIANIVVLAAIVGALVLWFRAPGNPLRPASPATGAEALTNAVIPQNGVELPAVWGTLGTQLVRKGVIDKAKFEALYAERGGLSAGDERLLSGDNPGKLVITPQNAGVVLNLLWAFGLANKNPVLEKGPMADPTYGGAGGFASTGGWTLGKDDAMKYYSAFPLVTLTPDEQALVERVAKNIYRPCCGNSTYFPDCNHGMAMLGLLELMASQGASEADMYKAALAVNSYWFPDTYLTIATYLKSQGTDWNSVDPKTVLGADYSSGAGYQNILRKTKPVSAPSGGGCGA